MPTILPVIRRKHIIKLEIVRNREEKINKRGCSVEKYAELRINDKDQKLSKFLHLNHERIFYIKHKYKLEQK